MRLKKLIKSIASAMVLAAVAVTLATGVKAYAASASEASVVVTDINYDQSTITVKLNDADSALLISDGKQKKWEYAPVSKDEDTDLAVLDISWIGLNTDYSLSLRGDVSAVPVKVLIPKQTKTFKATYSTLDGGKISFQNAKGKIQWKKKDAKEWEDFPTKNGSPDTVKFQEKLLAMCPNGASLMFRLASENGTSVTSPGKRASKEVYVTVAKKLAAPTIKVDDEKLTIAVTKDMQYRYCDEYGNPCGNLINDDGTPQGILVEYDDNGNEIGRHDPEYWISFSKASDYPLYKIAKNAMVKEADPSYITRDVYIQFRTKASSTKQMSNVTTIKIPAQRPMSDAAKNSIKLNYTSTSSFQIEIAAASADEPYEYCIINQKDYREGVRIESVKELKWRTVNSQTPVSVSKTKDKVDESSLVFVRRKAIKELGNDDYQIASPVMPLGSIEYPNDITGVDSKLKWLVTVAGRCNPDNIDGKLNFRFYSDTNSPISQIKFVDYASTGTVRGTLKINEDFTSTVSENGDYDPTNADTSDKYHYRYIIDTSIFSTAKIDSAAANNKNRRMLANITVMDSDDEFKSTSEKGIALMIHPATVVNNPSNDTAKQNIADKLGWDKNASDYTAKFKVPYSAKFERVVNSQKTTDDTQFRIRLDIGTRKVPAIDAGTQQPVLSANNVEITQIKYDGVTFAKDASGRNGKKYFTVEYADIEGTTSNNSGDEQRMAVVTVNVDAIEMNAEVDDRDKDTPLWIYLSNGEILKESVTINLRNTAVIVDYSTKAKGAQAITINEPLKLQDKVIVTGTNGQSEEKFTEHPDDYHICLKKFQDDYSVSLDKVTWNGQNICRNIVSSGEYITMDISNKALNDIYDAMAADDSQSASIRFEFDNGFVITTGWKITFNKARN